MDKYWSDTIWQRRVQDRLTWIRHGEAFAQPRTLRLPDDDDAVMPLRKVYEMYGYLLKGHCIEFKYYADGIHSGLTLPG